MARCLAAAAIAAVGLSAAACVTDIPPEDRTVWEADLMGEGAHALATGSAAAVSRGSTTESSISVNGLDAGTYAWGLFRGECAVPGEMMGGEAIYPELDASSGATTAEAFISLPMRSDRNYSARVRTLDDGAPVACGDFVPWE